MSIDWDGIKHRHPPSSIAERAGVHRITRAGRVYKGLCPFHDDHNPSFVIDDDTGKFACLAECGWCGGHSAGDIFDFVQELYGMEIKEAVAWIDGNIPTTTQPRPQRKPDPVKITIPDQAEMVRYVRESKRNEQQARKQWMARSIPPSAVRDYCIGYVKAFRPKTPARLSNGATIWRHPAPRYTIPWYDVRGNVVAINQRLDEAYAETAIESIEIADVVRKDIAKDRGISESDVSNKMLFDYIFGDKYWFKSGSSILNRIYNIQSVAHMVPSGLVQPQMPFVVSSEGEINVHTATHVLGVPAIGLKKSSTRYLAQALQNVEILIILEDRDEVRFQTDGTAFYPGQEIANRVEDASGKVPNQSVFRLTVPEGYGDINDMAGDNTLIDWFDAELSRIGLDREKTK